MYEIETTYTTTTYYTVTADSEDEATDKLWSEEYDTLVEETSAEEIIYITKKGN